MSINGSSAVAKDGGPEQPVWGSGGFHVKQWGELTLRNLNLSSQVQQQQQQQQQPRLSVSGDGKLHLAAMELPYSMLMGLLQRGLQGDNSTVTFEEVRVVGQQQGKCALTGSLSGKTAAAQGWSGGGKTNLGAGFCKELEAAMPLCQSCWPEIYRFTGTVQYTKHIYRNVDFSHQHIPGDFKKTTVTCVLCCLSCMC